MSQFPIPGPIPGGGGAPKTEGGGFSFNFSNLNPYLDSLLGRWNEVMSIQTERLRAQPQRDAEAFDEWLRKRNFDRDLANREYNRALAQDKEVANTTAFNRAQVEQQRRDQEAICTAARMQGIPCAAPGAGSAFSGSSEGGAGRSMGGYTAPVVNQVDTPAYGPRTAYGGSGAVVNNVYSPSSGPGQQYLSNAGNAASIASGGSSVVVPDFWKTDAGADDQCKDSRGNWVPCRDL